MNSETFIKSGLKRLQKGLGTLSLRSRLILTNILITTLAIAALGYYIYYRVEQSNANLTEQLDISVRQQAENVLQTVISEQSGILNQFFTSISNDVKGIDGSVEALLPHEATFSTGTYWDASQSLSQSSNGSWDNANNDVASVFIPGQVELTQSLVTELNTVKQLDFLAPNMLKRNSNIIAIYFGGRAKETLYYPNVDLAALVPSDFDVTQRPWYISASPENNPDRKVVWSDPYLDAAQNGLVITASLPVYKGSSQFRGVVAMDVQLNHITELVSKIHVGDTGYAFLIDSDRRLIAMPSAAYQDFGISPEAFPLGNGLDAATAGNAIPSNLWLIIEKMSAGENGLEAITFRDVERFIVYQQIPETGYSLGIVVPSNELLASATTARQQIIQETQDTILISAFPVLGILLLSILTFYLISNRLMLPLKQLSLVADEVATGNLNAKASIQRADEIGSLAQTFNRITSQLQGTLQGLEQRVAERTRNLELATEVGRTVSQVRDLDEMLKDACELILKEFNLYYVQVYLIDPSHTTLNLEAGTGSVAEQLLDRGHSLPLDAGSINGRAAVEKRAVVISDTAQSTTFRQNSLLPETRGEMAVPLIVANKVVGVLDMQSRSAGVLNNEVLPAFEALAGQLAVAIQNANLLAETEQARAEVEKQARRLVRTSWNEHLDAIHEPEQIGFVFDRKEITPFVGEDETPNTNMVSSSISVTGEKLGSLVVEIDDASPNEQTAELVAVVARQVAQQIENLRLLASAERYRYEAEAASRRITREGWQEFTDKTDEGLSYSYDLNEVRLQKHGEGQQMDGYALPLTVRDEPIGRLIVQGLEADDTESLSVASAVAERLAAHIEGLRQSQQTQSALSQSEKMFQASSVLNQAKALSEITSSTVDLMGISAINRALLVSFNYDSENNVDSLDVIANWWNGTGHEVTPVGTHYSQQVIRVMPMFISPVPVFFNDTHVDPRVDAKTMELVKRLNLRAVAVLPLHAGTQQIGALILEAEEPHAFTQAETRLFSALAPQIATVLDNRLQYERAQRQAERESKLNAISQKIQSATTVEAVLQIAARELGHTLGAPLTIAQLGLKDNAKSN